MLSSCCVAFKEKKKKKAWHFFLSFLLFADTTTRTMASTIRRLTKAVAAVARPRLRKGVVSPFLEVPSRIQKPPYYFRRNSSTMPLIQESNNIPILSEEEQNKMRESCKIASSVLEFACSLVKVLFPKKKKNTFLPLLLCCSLSLFSVVMHDHSIDHLFCFVLLEIQPGITTDEIDKIVTEEIFRHDAYPSPLHYHGFPKSICTSVNECACHGIPDNRPLVEVLTLPPSSSLSLC